MSRHVNGDRPLASKRDRCEECETPLMSAIADDGFQYCSADGCDARYPMTSRAHLAVARAVIASKPAVLAPFAE